jgi:hypothetical protein
MSLYEGDMQSRIMAGEKLEDVLKNPDAPKTDWTKIKDFSTSPFYTGTTYTKVLCKDGTTKTQTNDPNSRVLDACRDNGGRAEIKPIVNETVKLGVIKQDAEDKFYEKLGIQTQSGGFMSGKGLDSKIKGRALILVVLVAGYFAYKKFKK